MASAGSNLPPVIIKRVVKKGGGGHHGGAWKVAYADFVTAMMAFFLLLWLLNATTEDQKQAISNYFAPTTISNSKNGAGGMFGGRTFSDGALPYNGGAPGVAALLAPPQETGTPDEEEDTPGKPTTGNADKKLDLADRESVRKAAALEERQQFEQAAAALRQAIQETPDLKPLAASLVIDQTSEGLRIQIVDQERLEMFSRGSAQMHAHTRALMQKVVAAVRGLPHQVAVTGYTDATPYASDKGYSNWELSADRANSSRRALVELGLATSRITRVVGRADTDLLVPNEPTSSRNRRISITLLRKAPASAVN